MARTSNICGIGLMSLLPAATCCSYLRLLVAPIGVAPTVLPDVWNNRGGGGVIFVRVK